MKATIVLALATSLTLVSCTTLDPEYAEYKRQQQAQQNTPNPYGDPYGTPNANPYGVPGGGTGSVGDVGQYTPQNPAPYEALPGVPDGPSAAGSAYPTIPSPGTPAAPATGRTATHIVAKGETLWSLARRYGTTVEAIQQANGMTGTNIMYGTTIQIPTN